MLDDDQNRNRTMSTDPVRRDGMGAGMIALIAAIAVFALLFMWAPWSGPRTAENSGAGTTVGSSTTRPSAPMAPNTAPAPRTPAAPSTTR
jgi:hypothetical protein